MPDCQVLICGLGGLGCELLKNLLQLPDPLIIHLLDYDTVSLSNLTRAMYFRREDLGNPKALLLATHLTSKTNKKLVGHIKRIEEMEIEFFNDFHIIFSCFDNVFARRHLNGKLLHRFRANILSNPDISFDSFIQPLIDGGTEGYEGHIRVILPGYSSCIECHLELFPAEHIQIPLCVGNSTENLVDPNPQNHSDSGGDVEETSSVIPTLICTNAIIAAMMVLQAAQLLERQKKFQDFADSGFWFLNIQRGIYLENIQLNREPSCTQCSNLDRMRTSRKLEK